jgi:hypothetical protein
VDEAAVSARPVAVAGFLHAIWDDGASVDPEVTPGAATRRCTTTGEGDTGGRPASAVCVVAIRLVVIGSAVSRAKSAAFAARWIVSGAADDLARDTTGMTVGSA